MAKRWKPQFAGHVCSLGYSLLDWIHTYCCHGPGDVQGDPLDLDDELRDFVIECYELDPTTGRRLRREAILSQPKGRSKSETAGVVVVAEALAEVRFDGWDADGQPVGRPIRSPLIKCLATEENQAGNTFENAAFILGEWGRDTHPEVFAGTSGTRNYQSATTVYLPQGGEVRACSSGSASKDGGKETFVVPDESHLYVLPELRNMYATIMKNLGKRKLAEPWALQTTTAFKPGENSIAEQKLTAWRKGELDSSVLVKHREATGKVDIMDRDRTLRQLREVYGPAMDPETGWMEPERVYLDMLDPTICRDEAEAARYYLNRALAGSDAWIAQAVYDRQVDPRKVPLDEPISVGFDGSLNEDSTVLRGCCMSDGYRFTLGMWEKPQGASGVGWEVPRGEVLARFRQVLSTRIVSRAYCDPHEWRSDIDALAVEFGEDIVVPFATSRDTAMANALDRLHTDLVNGTSFHDADKRARLHYGNAYAYKKNNHRLVRKENPNSARKIDTVPTDALAYQARADAIADGWVHDPGPTYFRLPR